jgi:tRNA threonylcarbamoyladenosine biosynthesis protein TsaB
VIALALDTSHPVGGVALSVDGVAIETVRFGEGSSHLAEIGRAVDGALVGAGISVTDVDRIALVQGPGSFTGLRIGMSYAKGLCAGLCADMVVMSTLELLATPLLRAGTIVCPMVDARKGEVYGAVYKAAAGSVQQWTSAPALVEPCAREPEALVAEAKRYKPVYIGTGTLRYRALLESADPGCRMAGADAAQPSAALLAEMAPVLDPLSVDDLAALEPTYLRPSDAVFKPLKPVEYNG